MGDEKFARVEVRCSSICYIQIGDLLLGTFKEKGAKERVDIINAAHESALLSARATAMEEACRAVCDLCREGKKPSKTMDEGGHDVFFHNELINGCSWWACGAEAIRAKLAEGGDGERRDHP